MLCSESSLVNYGEQKARGVTLHCGCWSCEICEPRRKARLVSDVAAGQPTKLLTLTTRRVEGGDAIAEARRQGEALAKLVRMIRREHPKHVIAFFAVREATKLGWPHLHVALRAPFLEWAWLVEQWEALTGSRGVDIRAIYKAGNAAKYLAKYIGKAPHRFGTTKRYWSSRNWRDPVVEPEPRPSDWNTVWFIVNTPIGKLAQLYWLRRWEVNMKGRFGYFEARAPP